MREIAKMARDDFERDWPKNSGGRGRRGKVRIRAPGEFLAEALVQTIGRFWRTDGLDRISSAPSGEFARLLIAFHIYSVGGEIGGRPFAEALEKVPSFVEAERARLGLLSKASRGAAKARASPSAIEARQLALKEARDRLRAASSTENEPK